MKKISIMASVMLLNLASGQRMLQDASGTTSTTTTSTTSTTDPSGTSTSSGAATAAADPCIKVLSSVKQDNQSIAYSRDGTFSISSGITNSDQANCPMTCKIKNKNPDGTEQVKYSDDKTKIIFDKTLRQGTTMNL